MATPDTTIEDAIAAWQQTTLTGAQLMRVMVSHGAWYVAISQAAADEAMASNTLSRLLISVDDEGVKRLFVFSGDEAYRAYQTETGDDRTQTFLTVAGAWLFQLPLEGVDFVAIDPYTDHNIAYDRDHLASLAAIARAVVIERALIDLRAGGAATEAETHALIKKVADYQSFQLALREVDGRMVLAYAPDSNERALAAVFTHDDAFGAFARQREDPTLRSLALDGRSLLSRLRGMGLDGIVFNCGGPSKPVAFALGIADVVLRMAGSAP